MKQSLAALLVFLVAVAALFFAPLGPLFSFWAEKKMESLANAQVSVEGFGFSLYGGITARRLTIHPQGLSKETLLLKDVSVEHDFGALLTGRYRARRVHIGSVEAAATESIAQWGLSLMEDVDFSESLPELVIGGGRVDPRLPGDFKPVFLEGLRISARPAEDGDVSGTIFFTIGKNDVKIKFDADREHGFVQADLLVSGFDVSFLPELEIAGIGMDPSSLRVDGVLTGAVTFLTSTRQVVGDLVLSGITVAHPASGIVAANGRAGIALAGREIVFHGGQLQAAGGRIVIPRAAITLEENGIDTFRFQGEAKGLELALLEKMGLFALLPERFHPGPIDAGSLDGAVSGMWRTKGGFDYHADIDIREGSWALEEPGIDISSFAADAVIQTGGKVTVKSASAHFWDGRAEASGTFDVLDMEMENPDFHVRFADIAQNDALMSLLPEEVREGIRFTRPSNASVGGHIQLSGDALSLDVTVQAETLSPPTLPYVFSNAAGNIRWSTGAPRVVFEAVSGDIDGSPVQGAGALLIEDRLAADFTIQGQDMPLDREILDWLNVDLGDWEVGGRFDLDLQARQWRPVENSVAGSLSGITAQVDGTDVFFSHPAYGRVAESLQGRLIQGPDGLALDRCEGLVLGIRMEGSGRFPLDDGEEDPYLLIHSETFDLSSERYDQLPFDIGLEGVEMAGRASLTGKIEAARQDDSFALSGNIAATIEDATITYTGLPMGASGSLVFRFSDNGHSGSISFDELMIGRFAAEHCSADFTYDAPALVFRNIHILAYGGRIDSLSTRINTADKTWATQFGISRMNLKTLSNSFEITEEQSLEGELQSTVSLEGRSFAAQAVKGKGEVAVNNGKLYSFPILVAVLRVLDLRLPTQNPATDAYGVFHIENGTVNVEHLLFKGGSMPIYLEGFIGLRNDVGFADQPVYLLVTLARNDGILDRIPLVNLLKHHTIDFFRRIILQARVTGTIGDYQVSTLSTPVTVQIQKMWSFFQKVTPSAEEIEDLF